MPLPGDVATKVVHGKWLDMAGAARSGSVSFTPTVGRLVDGAGHVVLTGAPIVSALSGTGEVSVTLPCTDDPDLTGTPFSYLVLVALAGEQPDTFHIGVPAAGGTVELADVTPVSPVTPTGTYVVSVNGQSGVVTGVGGGSPSGSVTAETSYGAASSAGASSSYSRGDHTHGSPALGASGTTAAAGNDSRFANLCHYPASGYGGISLSADPMGVQVPGSFGPNQIAYCRMFIPAGKAITGAYAAIRSAASHDGINNGNRLAVYDDTGANPVNTPVDETLWTLAGWRGAALTGGPIAAQAVDRFVYVLALVRGMSASFVNPSGANDANAPYLAVGPAQTKRRCGYVTASSLPASFDATSYGTASGFAALFLLT